MVLYSMLTGHDVELNNAKRGYWNYNTKTAMEKMIKEEGYDVIEMSMVSPCMLYSSSKTGKQNPVVYKVSEITLD